jgi:CD63 antigen
MIKYVLFIFNLICAIGGIALMAVGGVALKKIGDVKHVFEDGDHPGFFPAAIIALGALVFVIAFFGCCGAIRESQCLLNLYSLCLLAVIVLQIILAVFVLVYNHDIQVAAFKGWDRLWAGRDVSELNRRAIDQVQRTIECCGSNSFLDWLNQAPASCCPSDSGSCTTFTMYKTGCKQQIKTVIQNSASWIAYLSIAMAIVELVGVVFGCCLSSNIRNSSRLSF